MESNKENSAALDLHQKPGFWSSCATPYQQPLKTSNRSNRKKRAYISSPSSREKASGTGKKPRTSQRAAQVKEQHNRIVEIPQGRHGSNEARIGAGSISLSEMEGQDGHQLFLPSSPPSEPREALQASPIPGLPHTYFFEGLTTGGTDLDIPVYSLGSPDLLRSDPQCTLSSREFLDAPSNDFSVHYNGETAALKLQGSPLSLQTRLVDSVLQNLVQLDDPALKESATRALETLSDYPRFKTAFDPSGCQVAEDSLVQLDRGIKIIFNACKSANPDRSCMGMALLRKAFDSEHGFVQTPNAMIKPVCRVLMIVLGKSTHYETLESVAASLTDLIEPKFKGFGKTVSSSAPPHAAFVLQGLGKKKKLCSLLLTVSAREDTLYWVMGVARPLLRVVARIVGHSDHNCKVALKSVDIGRQVKGFLSNPLTRESAAAIAHHLQEYRKRFRA
ncbi:hypothetical protein BKA70DRAFT_1559611 [Coprinopsis sp. MPI-PUGE-AT-0042]|nr:hypothetical protein BKA70DRAFT_1559611 [Coprinopsis sp. MPI-PUGE-AT-0042]